MTERTVTDTQFREAINKRVHLDERIALNMIFDELFPELPKVGELIWVWNSNDATDEGAWRKFFSLDAHGNILTKGVYGDYCEWDNYRRLTPAEKGEG
tara:strand:- start:867 stop:1160 length:294 start_codon:yes stop_codon:yes gene_type:complete